MLVNSGKGGLNGQKGFHSGAYHQQAQGVTVGEACREELRGSTLDTKK